ncbi:MAG: hypothetical protein HOV82_16955 [Streptomyces sp.]|nr:hypothetical protein [Streptomyces sp.]NUP36220.1 hypothetical protein [Streptomyces sp.]NUS75567.1 hypothetical protein [Streptomyces sp.]
MSNATHASPAARSVDVTTMRQTVDRVLDPDSAPNVMPPAGEELDTLILTLRGQLALIVPEIETALRSLHKTDPQRYGVLACLSETRQKLRVSVDDRATHEVAVALARRLARSLNALCYHYERLTAGTADRG